MKRERKKSNLIRVCVFIYEAYAKIQSPIKKLDGRNKKIYLQYIYLQYMHRLRLLIMERKTEKKKNSGKRR